MKLGNKEEAKISFDMTPMIDIVFQLLIFFVMTFKIIAIEGDFSIRMPMGTAQGIAEVPTQPIRLRLRTDGAVLLENRQIPMSELRQRVQAIAQPNMAPGTGESNAEIELDCDYDLPYKQVIEAITQCTGYRDANGHIQKIVEKIKFAPPRAPAG